MKNYVFFLTVFMLTLLACCAPENRTVQSNATDMAVTNEVPAKSTDEQYYSHSW